MLEKYFRAAAPAEERLRVINLIADLTARDFGGYHAVLAVHAEGSIEAEKMQIFRAYDAKPALALGTAPRRDLRLSDRQDAATRSAALASRSGTIGPNASIFGLSSVPLT